MSNQVREKDFRAHLRIDPPVKLSWSGEGSDDQLSFSMHVPVRLRSAAHSATSSSQQTATRAQAC